MEALRLHFRGSCLEIAACKSGTSLIGKMFTTEFSEMDLRPHEVAEAKIFFTANNFEKSRVNCYWSILPLMGLEIR